jgi:outer membrane protein TolC
VRDTELTIWQQVERAYVTVQQAEEAIGAAQKGVESADENFRLARDASTPAWPTSSS